MTSGLHRVGVEEHTTLAADLADLSDRLDGPDLVVGKHDRHQTGVFADRFCHLLRRDNAVCVHIQQRDLKAALLQFVEGVEHRVVLKRCGNDVAFSFALAAARRAHDRLIVRFAAAGSEIDLPWLRADAGCDPRPRILQCFLCFLGKSVQAGWIAVVFLHIWQHCVDGCFAHFCCCCVVCVDHMISSCSCKSSIVCPIST